MIRIRINRPHLDLMLEPRHGAGYVPPMKPTLVEAPPTAEGWIHEIKHDGYRVQLVIDGGSICVFTKNGHDWTSKFRCIANDARLLSTVSAVIDGEAVVQDPNGRSDFQALRSAIDNAPERVVMFAFDLLWLDGQDVRGLPLIERRSMLRDLLGENEPDAAIQVSEDVADGPGLFAAADAMDLEGIVSKKANSKYWSGYAKGWLKTKCMAEAEFALIGVDTSTKGPSNALLAREVDGVLEYAGSAWVTLATRDRERFWAAAERLACERPAVTLPKVYKARWCVPEFKVRARYLKGSDKLRHATLAGVA